MSVVADCGSFSTGTGTGDLTAQAPSLGGATPQLILFMSADPRDASGDAALMFGAATGIAERANVALHVEGATTTDTAHLISTDAVLKRLTGTAAVDGAVDISAVGADSFTPTIDDAFSDSMSVSWLALAGLTNVKVGTILADTDAPGSQSYTGIGFRPDLIIFFGIATTVGTIGANGQFMLGWYDGTTQRCISGISQDNVADSNSWGLISSTYPWVSMLVTDGTVLDAFTVTSLDSDGFTINRATGTNNRNVGYIAIKGCRAKTLDTAFRTDTNNQAVTGAGFTPVTALFMSKPRVTAFESAGIAEMEFSLGWAVSSTKRTGVWLQDPDALVVAAPVCSHSTARVLVNQAANGSTNEGDMDFVSFDSDGYTLDQIVASGTAYLVTSLVIGSLAGSGASWYHNAQQE